MTRALPTAVALLLAVASASAAYAQDDPTAQARAHFELGVALIEQSRWSDAVTELEAARAIHATAPVLYNLGIAYRAVGRVSAALRAFAEFLDLLGAEGSATRRTEVEGYVAELTTMLAHVRVSLEPPDATLEVDGAPTAAGEIAVDAGVHVLHASAPDRVAVERRVELATGETAVVRMVLEVSLARLEVDSAVAGAVVVVDGRIVGAPPVSEALSPGDHVVEVRAPGRDTSRREMTLVGGETVRWQADLSGGESLVESPWLWIGIGVALVAGGVAIGTTVALSGTEAPIVGDLGLVTGVLVSP